MHYFTDLREYIAIDNQTKSALAIIPKVKLYSHQSRNCKNRHTKSIGKRSLILQNRPKSEACYFSRYHNAMRFECHKSAFAL